jgi:hypothetical protein
MPAKPSFKSELMALVKRHNLESKTKIPDFILADFLVETLQRHDRDFESAVRQQELWRSRTNKRAW